MKIKQELLSLADPIYRDFEARLIPSIDKTRIIGVRTPALRALAKRIFKTEEAKAFISDLPHEYYEEYNLHAFLIEEIRDFSECRARVLELLPYVDNWATCDSLSPRVFFKDECRAELLKLAYELLDSRHVYGIRYGIVILMKHFLGEKFREDQLLRVAAVRSDDYYVKMAVAWYFASALTKQYDSTLRVIQNKVLDPFTHNKAISKARDSLAIEQEKKNELKKYIIRRL